MAVKSVNISIRVDESVKTAAEEVFQNLGINLTAGLNLYLYQVARQGRIPFELTTGKYEQSRIQPFPKNRYFAQGTDEIWQKARIKKSDLAEGLPYGFGSMKDEIWISDDFDEPLDEMTEYME
ncbi:MAG: type II toxin-antitoxin system RelB/DinJ family antitoxin [Erysipelotrichaceae bacterium]|jgi:DNA-damage-inducible protein J|nr:type II toxin-antitoxin system RelB/DinJ family antitoxin [Erysipelotrichaceae bacterium]